MKNTLLLYSALLCLTNCNYSDNVITEKDVREILEEWGDAYKTKNAEIMERILHEDWVYSGNSNGSLSNKRSSIEELKNSDYQFITMDISDLDIEYYDEIAVVRAHELLKLKLSNGDTLELRLRFTDVYQKENGITQAISTHTSPITN